MIPDWNLDFLVTNSQRWISAQREKYRPAAKPLSPIELSALNSIFGPETLEAARVVRIPEIENPDFYTQLSSVPLDFRPMAGITYRDTILVSESRVPTPTPIVLLFHELVHVVQYAILGVAEFAQQYVLGWARNGFDYSRIPLEVQAYSLQHQFEQGRLHAMDVESLIRTGLRQ